MLHTSGPTRATLPTNNHSAPVTKILDQYRHMTVRILAILILCGFCSLSTQLKAQQQRPLNLAWSLYPGYSPFVIAFITRA